MRIIGVDSGLLRTGWGIIDCTSGAMSYVDCGIIKASSKLSIGDRLSFINNELKQVLKVKSPEFSAIEDVFANQNPSSTMKLGMARGAALLTLAQHGLDIGEYSPNTVKKALVGRGHASKDQVAHMVAMLLPKSPRNVEDDITDALAVAICHAHHMETAQKIKVTA